MVKFTDSSLILALASEEPEGDYLDYQRAFLTVVQELFAWSPRPDLGTEALGAVSSVLEFVKRTLPEEAALKGLREEATDPIQRIAELEQQLAELRQSPSRD